MVSVHNYMQSAGPRVLAQALMCSLPPGTCSGRSRGLKPQSICSCAGDYGQNLITCGFVLGPNGLTTACMAAGFTSPAHCMGYCNAAASSRSPAAHEHHQVGMSAAASSCMTRDVLVASLTTSAWSRATGLCRTLTFLQAGMCIAHHMLLQCEMHMHSSVVAGVCWAHMPQQIPSRLVAMRMPCLLWDPPALQQQGSCTVSAACCACSAKYTENRAGEDSRRLSSCLVLICLASTTCLVVAHELAHSLPAVVHESYGLGQQDGRAC